MKRLCLLVSLLWAQTYNHPTTGVGGTYSGGCQVHTCSGNYYDNGGPTNNYANNVNWVYWTFCPNNSTQCLRVSFSSFNVESGSFGEAVQEPPAAMTSYGSKTVPLKMAPFFGKAVGPRRHPPSPQAIQAAA